MSRAGSTPTLDLDRLDALACDLRDLALGVGEAHQADRVGDRDARARGAAEQAMDRQPGLAAGEVVGGELERRLGVGEALDGAVHAGVQLDDVARLEAAHRRRQIGLDHMDRGAGALAEIAAELAAPVFQRRRLAPAHAAGLIDQPDQHIAADRLGQPGPFMLAPGRQRDVDQLHPIDRRRHRAPLWIANCDHSIEAPPPWQSRVMGRKRRGPAARPRSRRCRSRWHAVPTRRRRAASRPAPRGAGWRSSATRAPSSKHA